ncbi:hypothetical protein Q5P01_000881 [Channa striata]|uniref:Glycosyltransferase family 92 protein n=1 Tax=Channa striata TaxID=64152 RepID=A0AA88LIP6_CHASR|nr:hypothetical protein Q5P01_000881 [Channa striata]
MNKGQMSRLGIYRSAWMARKKLPNKKVLFVFISVVTVLLFLVRKPRSYGSIPTPLGAEVICPHQVSEQTITPLNNTKHFLVSAYMDERVNGFSLRIIGIFRRDSIQPLDYLASNKKQKTNRKEENKPQFDFTVCVSSLFGDYNNVLQFAQTLEVYRLLGVNRVVIYNTSCGPDLERLLQSYSQEGFVELVPWPIDRYLNPSPGWLFSQHGGDVHYFGQLTTLNECIYRSMDRSRYVLLNDIDEIIMPYQHRDLKGLMDMLQQKHPNTGVFLIENHVFPKKHFEPSRKFNLPQWKGVPGVNILEHIYREDPDRNIYHFHKMIVQPK